MADKLAPDSVIAARREVCAACPSKKDMSGNPLFVFIDKLGGTEITGLAENICGECLCPIEWRTRKVHHECPLGKWGPYDRPAA